MTKLFKVVLGLAGLTLAMGAQAHSGAHSESGLMAGLGHPLLGWDHLAAAMAVGMWAATQRSKAVLMLPASFIVALVAGIALGTTGLALPLVEPMILFSLIIVGAALAFNAKANPMVASGLLAGFALFHGYAHAAEMPLTASLVSYAFGLVTATAALHLVGIWSGRNLAPMVTRLSGVLLGAAGLAALAV